MYPLKVYPAISRLAADPNVLGRTLTLDAITLTIIGVMPADCHFPGRGVDYWRAMRLDGPTNESRNNNYLTVMARLKSGVALEQARSEMRTVADQRGSARPPVRVCDDRPYHRRRGRGRAVPRARTRQQRAAGVSRRRTAWQPDRVLLAAGSAGPQLLAFTVASRSREIGVRMALGATARDVMRMVMGRSAALAIVGVTAGAALAYAAGRWMQALLYGVNPADAQVFGAAVIISFLMVIAGSLLPALRAIRVDPTSATRAD